jgi:flagellar motility protein MotE (MotC chaperone)
MINRKLILGSAAVLAVAIVALALPGRAADGAAHEVKTDAKADAKSDAKTGAASHGAAEAPTGVGGAAGEGAKPGAAEAAKVAPSKPQPRTRKAPEEPKLPPGQGPAAPSPLSLDGLKQDLKRESGGGGFNPNASSRSKVEQLLAELIKTREALHQDTAKLEAMAMGENGEASGPATPGAPGQPVAKNPLDVLAKALRGIKPEQAAPIVARVDKALAATVLLRMPPVDAGKIMGALKPETAAELATQIALRAPPTRAGGKR